MPSKRESEILEVIRKHTAYELAEKYLLDIQRFCSVLLRVLDCGALAAKIYILMFMYRRDWTCTELALELRRNRQNVFRALKTLERRGFIIRVSRTKWHIKP